MKNKLLPILFISIFIILLISPLVKSEIQFWQEKTDSGNGTIKNHLVLFYSKGGFGVTDDYVSGNNPYEVYLLYNVYVKKWNADNPNYKVDNCEFIVKFWGHLENTTTILTDLNFTQADSDIFNGKYFVKLGDGDGMIADQICKFQNNNFTDLDIPAEMQIVTPTWECKACQYYEWSVQESAIAKTQSIGDNVVSVSNYIKKLFMINFEIWLALFWFFLIFMIFTSVGLIFVVMYWLYLYLRRVMK